MYKNVLEYLEKTAAGAAADRGVSDVDTFMTYPAFVEMARNAGAAMTGLVPAGRIVIQIHEGAVAVGIVAADDAAVGGCLLADDEVGSGR